MKAFPVFMLIVMIVLISGSLVTDSSEINCDEKEINPSARLLNIEGEKFLMNKIVNQNSNNVIINPDIYNFDDKEYEMEEKDEKPDKARSLNPTELFEDKNKLSSQKYNSIIGFIHDDFQISQSEKLHEGKTYERFDGYSKINVKVEVLGDKEQFVTVQLIPKNYAPNFEGMKSKQIQSGKSFAFTIPSCIHTNDYLLNAKLDGYTCTLHRNADLHTFICKQNCPICCTGIHDSDGRTLPCSHVYHRLCIKKWLQSKCNCPICRQEFERTNVIFFTVHTIVGKNDNPEEAAYFVPKEIEKIMLMDQYPLKVGWLDYTLPENHDQKYSSTKLEVSIVVKADNKRLRELWRANSGNSFNDISISLENNMKDRGFAIETMEIKNATFQFTIKKKDNISE